MYAMLGDVRFELLTGFTDFEEQHDASFAKHEVLAGRPRLQAMGNDLTSVRFSLRLHWKLGNPDTAFNGLLAAKEAQQAVSLVYGSGRFAGWWVIESLSGRTLITDGQGRTAAREVDVQLTEFVGDPNNPLPTPGVMSGGQNPLLALLPESVRATASDVAAAVETGVRIYRAAEEGIGQVQSLVYAAKDLANDPAGLLNLLGDALNIGGGTLAKLNGLPEVTAALGNLTAATELAAQAGQAANQLGSAVGSLRSALEGGTAAEVLGGVVQGVDSAMASLQNGGAAVESLMGLLATRSDG